MSPIPRCDLRQPTIDRKKSSRILDANSLKVVSKPKTSSSTKRHQQVEGSSSGRVENERSDVTTTIAPPADTETAVTPTEASSSTTNKPSESTKQAKITPVGCLPETSAESDAEQSAEISSDDRCHDRVRAGPDSEETIKVKKQIESGELPRDTADSIKRSVKMQKLAYGEAMNPICTTGEEVDFVENQEWRMCPGTPGDTTYDWLVFERPESPKGRMPAGKKTFENDDISNLTPTQLEERLCKRRKTRQKYIKMWGSEEAVRRWTKHKLEARRLRKQLEKKHAQNAWLRERMRNHARKKRRMYRCKDQSKIPSLNEDIQINKAFYFRLNYNNQVPCMPSDMDKHFAKFKKPPFKNAATIGCVKAVDEFEKLRVQKKHSSS